MKKEIIFFILLGFLTGCVPKSDYEKLKSENDELKIELSYVKEQYEQLLDQKRQAEIEKQKKPYISETKAKEFLRDYYKFYNGDWTYRNAVFRRLDNNSFTISLEECIRKGDFSNSDFFWNASVKTLTVNNDGTYNVR